MRNSVGHDAMSRMKAHWPRQVSPRMELRSAIRWLEFDLRSSDIYRCLAICEAITILQWCLDAIIHESEQRSERLRAEHRNCTGMDDNQFSSGG